MLGMRGDRSFGGNGSGESLCGGCAGTWISEPVRLSRTGIPACRLGSWRTQQMETGLIGDLTHKCKGTMKPKKPQQGHLEDGPGQVRWAEMSQPHWSFQPPIFLTILGGHRSLRCLLSWARGPQPDITGWPPCRPGNPAMGSCQAGCSILPRPRPSHHLPTALRELTVASPSWQLPSSCLLVNKARTGLEINLWGEG